MPANEQKECNSLHAQNRITLSPEYIPELTEVKI